jgi:hypothetical protein
MVNGLNGTPEKGKYKLQKCIMCCNLIKLNFMNALSDGLYLFEIYEDANWIHPSQGQRPSADSYEHDDKHIVSIKG